MLAASAIAIGLSRSALSFDPAENSGSQVTPRWRRESRANPSLEVGVFRAWELRTIPRPLWMIIERKRAISGS
jgi:hypothetical protein